jgi:two-component system sensor histidine kinase BaeS
MMADGRVITNGGGLPAPLEAQVRTILDSWVREGVGPGPERMGRPDGGPGRFGPPGPGPSAGRGRGAFRLLRPWPVIVGGSVVGIVAVPPLPPYGFLFARYAPTLGLVAVGALIVGAVMATAIVFGPARRRLRAVEDAARRLGAGDLSARAPEQGGDEVAAVAAAFNAMATDLEARASSLAESDRVRRQLLADVSHELATPVTAMRGYLETLTMPELSLDEPTRERYLQVLGDETTRLERLIGDLLDLARLEGGVSIVMAAVSVRSLFDRVAARHERACQAAGVRLSLVTEPGAETLRGDADRLEQALQNLTANAVRYAPAGSTIELKARPTDVGPVLSVTDEGPGIEPEHLPRVFDRFYKGEPSRAARNPASGSGLGLSIAKAIVERHGGRLSVTSRPGRTVFEFNAAGDVADRGRDPEA